MDNEAMALYADKVSSEDMLNMADQMLGATHITKGMGHGWHDQLCECRKRVQILRDSIREERLTDTD